MIIWHCAVRKSAGEYGFLANYDMRSSKTSVCVAFRDFMAPKSGLLDFQNRALKKVKQSNNVSRHCGILGAHSVL